MPRPRKYATDAERKSAYRARLAETQDKDFAALQAVVSEAALLAQARGLPYESLGALVESLRRLREQENAA